MTLSIKSVDFSKGIDIRSHATGRPQDGLHKARPISADGKVLTKKQIRARARRKMNRTARLTTQEAEILYTKPVEEWDLEELARGRPRDSKGGFRGPKPKWINSSVHELAMQKYVAAIKSDMRASTTHAVDMIRELIVNEDLDDKGKPIVPPSVKLQAATFLLEHVVGKPTQRVEQDISVKLQGILGQVMVNPAEMPGQYNMAHYPGITMAMATAEDRDEDEDGSEG